METAIVALFASMGLSFIGMAAIVFDKSRLIDFFSSVCMALGGVVLVLSFIGMLLI